MSTLSMQSYSPSEEEERRGGRTKELRSRKTIAATASPKKQQQPSSPHAKPRARLSMPSHLSGVFSTPQSKSTRMLFGSLGHGSPKRTPGSSDTPVENRCDILTTNSIAILWLYEDFAGMLEQPETEVEKDLDVKLKRKWDAFSTSKRLQLLPQDEFHDHFLDRQSVLELNSVERDSILAEEVSNAITCVNRATFVHYIAQLPFRDSSSTSTPGSRWWTMDKFVAHLLQEEPSRWPVREIAELLAVRRDFFRKIVTRRPQVVVTVDDLFLFNDLCTQIFLYYLWDISRESNAKRRAERIQEKVDDIFSVDIVPNSLSAGVELSEEEERAVESLTWFYERIVEKRKQQFDELANDPRLLTRLFPYKDTAVSLLRYILTLHQSPSFPLKVLDVRGLMIPRHNIFSLSLLGHLDQAYGSDMLREEDQGLATGSEEPPTHMPDVEEESEAAGKKRTRRAGRRRGARSVAGVSTSSREDEESGRESEGGEKGQTEGKDGAKGRMTGKRTRQRGGKEAGTQDEAGPSTATRTAMRFNKNHRLERVEESEMGKSITGNRGVVESVRDHEFDEDDSDPFLSKQMPSRAKKAKKRKRKRAVGSKEKARDEESERDERRQIDSVDIPDVEEVEELPELPAKRGGRAANSPSVQKGDGTDEFEEEMVEEQLEAEKRASEDRRKERKRRREERGSGSEWSEGQEASRSSKGREEKSGFRYATGGNAKGGRVFWTSDERECLLDSLQQLSLQEGDSSRTVWAYVLKRHGLGGIESNRLKGRNNVQLKDKARNEVKRMRKANETVPDWLRPYGRED